MPKPPLIQRIVLLGGGHTHALILEAWIRSPITGVQLTLISDVALTPYSGMLPGHVAGFYSYRDCHINLQRLTQIAGVSLVQDQGVGLDLVNNQVLCQEHPPVPFDVLSIDIGSTPRIPHLPGATEWGVAVKPVATFLTVWQRWLEALPAVPGEQTFPTPVDGPDCCNPPDSVGIIGGGVGGVELALAIQTRWQQMEMDPVTIHLFQRGSMLLSHQSPAVRRMMMRILEQHQIQVHLHADVRQLQSSGPGLPVRVEWAEGLWKTCDRIFWVTDATAPAWLQTTGLALDAKGFIAVGNTLQSLSHPQVFACGDIAAMQPMPCPKAGVFAVRQAPTLWKNLQRLVRGQPLQPYRPQKRYLSLIGTGLMPNRSGQLQPTAIATWGSFCLGPSPWLWCWKDYIDRRFMRRF